MKNQYVGDIGDYGKYGLLRFLAQKGIHIGVNWYLTDNDSTRDGKFTDYLKDTRENGDKQYDDELFRALQTIADKGKKKCVQDIEVCGIIPGAVFYSEVLKPEPEKRDAWHERALTQLLCKDINLIFADPDNGTWREQRKLPRKTGEKYARIEELRRYYDEGKDVVYYCHKARRKPEAWQAKMREFNADSRHNAKIIVLTYHRGTQRSYIFAIHPEHYTDYDAMLKKFINSAWGSIPVKGKKPPFSRESL